MFLDTGPPASPRRTASPKVSDRTRLSHGTFIHILYFGIFQRTGVRQGGGKTEAGGQRGSPFPSYPSVPNHTGSKHKEGGEAQMPPPVEEAARSYTHATHTNKPARRWAGGITEKQSAVGSRAGKQQSPHRWPVPPIPFLLQPQSIPRLCLAILLGPLAAFFLLEAKRKKGTEQGGCRPPLSPTPHARWSVPCPQWSGLQAGS